MQALTLCLVAAVLGGAKAALVISVDSFSKYPDYSGSLSVAGKVTMAASTGDATQQVLMWDLTGLDTTCVFGAGDSIANGCGIHVHLGTSCAVAANVGGHYYSGGSDPWADVVYVSDGSGNAMNSTTMNTGLTTSQMTGRVFVVHEKTNGARIACGTLVTPSTTVRAFNFAAYPDYSGSLSSVAGAVSLYQISGTTQVLTWQLTGLDTTCVAGAGDSIANGCGIHVHTGTSCAVAANVGGHYWSPSSSADPWADIVYVADGSGNSQGAAMLDTGLTMSQLAAKAFVVHKKTNGGRIACALLGSEVDLTKPSVVYVETFSKYPDYTGYYLSWGNVAMAAASGDDTTQVLAWDLSGLDTDCVLNAANSVSNGCGIHVHTGTSCSVAANVGGHYWSPSSVSDPWANIVYVSASGGTSTSFTSLTTGLTTSEMAGRAFVVHELTNGARIACGTLVAPSLTISVNNFAAYPGYTPGLNAAGTVTLSASSSSSTTQVLTWQLTGLDTTCVAGAGDSIANGCGIHVHTGTSCADANNVGGHYWSPSSDPDPWADIVYVADGSGNSQGAAIVKTGLTMADLAGKAFVIHQKTAGTRIACTVLGSVVDLTTSVNPGTSPTPSPIADSANELTAMLPALIVIWAMAFGH